MLCGALSAFGVLSHAVEGIELSMAGGVRGEVGLIAMAIFGIALFGQCLRFRGGWGWG
ncbi:SMR family transporter [Dyella flava]|uniref:SMR family transporter n=1 Tax=Dyella flava TaxID=1920170 RepID=UPI0024E0B699|nr:SMR family transporter [Dyella flava]